MDYIRAIERQQIREDIPQVRVADNVKVHYRIKEGDRERIQVFQGDVIRRQGESVRETFTVRKISFSIGVERTFPVHSPKIEKIEVTRKGDVRRAKKKYLASGIRKYSIVVWNAITYILPAVAAAGLVVLVRSGQGLRFVLNVQVNGENVGYVESEQVFENAREDVQSRINTAKRMLQASGSAVEDTSWDVYPTYSLSIGNQTMTESEIANAILRTASDEIINGTAVYVDDQLLYVTTEGDHLRSYLENIKAPFENAMDSSVYTAFAHNIRLVDGVYLQESVSSYADVINALTEGGGIHTYTAVDGDTCLLYTSPSPRDRG